MIETFRVISIASATDATAVPQHVAPAVYLLFFGALALGCRVYYRALGRLANDGGRLRRDLLGFPDVPVLAVILAVLGLSVVSAWIVKSPEATELKAEHILAGAFQFAVFPIGILFFLYARNVSVVEVFGLAKVRPLKALGYALGFLAALLPLFVLASEFATRKLGSDAKLQPLVLLYQDAVRQQDWQVVLHTCLAAGVIAPISEEILFRGYLYQTLKRYIGAVPSAFIGALLFAAIHNNAAGFPGLALLALALTIAFEWSGSLLVPIIMHATFNSMSLAWGAWMASRPL